MKYSHRTHLRAQLRLADRLSAPQVEEFLCKKHPKRLHELLQPPTKLLRSSSSRIPRTKLNTPQLAARSCKRPSSCSSPLRVQPTGSTALSSSPLRVQPTRSTALSSSSALQPPHRIEELKEKPKEKGKPT